MSRIIRSTIAGHLIIPKREIPERLYNTLVEILTWENPEYRDARIKGQSTKDIVPYILGIREIGDKVYIAREFYGEVEALAARYGYQLDIKDNRIFDEKAKPFPHKIKLWKSQIPAARRMLSDKHGHQGVLVAPCGGGKTNILLYVMCELGQRSIVLAHTNDLMHQWMQRIKEFTGLTPGIIQGDKYDVREITVASVMTLARRELDEEFLQHFGLVALDEAHHCPAESFKEVMDQFHAYFRFGATATPGRADELEGLLFAICGPIIAEVKRKDLLAEGKIIPTAVQPVETDFDYPYRGMRSWHPMIRALVNSRRRNEQIVRRIIQEHRSGDHIQLVLSKQIDHLASMQSLLQQHAPNIASSLLIAGGTKKDSAGNIVRSISMSKAEREATIAAARRGDIRVLFGTSLADEGLDFPRLDRVHLSFPTRAEGKVTQQVGRIQRAARGKSTAIVFDYVDSVGLLRDQWADRRRAYHEIGLEIHKAIT
jgi:superfamily II DNA or RNA helicase